MAIPLANWNGEILPLEEVKVSVLDRGFLFGDAIYEVIRVYHGRPFSFEAHLQRLQRNLDKMKLAADVNEFRQRTLELLQRANLEDAVIYMQVTRGVARRTHRYPEPAVPTNQLIWIDEFKDPYITQRETGVRVITLPDQRWKRCDIKSVNLLANCMAAQTAYEQGCPEALLYDEDGTLIEGTRTSLFGVRNGNLLTAPLGENVLPGITRKLLLELANGIDLPYVEGAITRDELMTLDELFLTGTTTEILPIVQVDEQRIGQGTVGPVGQRLMQAYRETVGAETS